MAISFKAFLKPQAQVSPSALSHFWDGFGGRRGAVGRVFLLVRGLIRLL